MEIKLSTDKSIVKKILHPIKQIFKNSTFRYIVRRIASGIVTLFFIIIAVFLLLRMIPKDGYYNQSAMDKMSDIQKENYMNQIDEKYGFNDPLIVQLGEYIWNILPVPKEICVNETYDDDFNVICSETKIVFSYLGESLVVQQGELVTDLLAERCPVSFKIGIISLLLSWCIGYPLGILMAKNKGKAFDKFGNGIIVANLAIPSLVFYFLIQYFSLAVLRLPQFFDETNFATWITPIFAIVALSFAGEMLWVRRFMVDEGNADYVKFARSKGLSENRTMFTHVFRNAIVPLVRNLPGAVIGTIIGSYYVEKTWSIPGSGMLLISAMNQVKPDNTLVQGLVIVYASISMGAFILGDIITVFFDPRIKLTKK